MSFSALSKWLKAERRPSFRRRRRQYKHNSSRSSGFVGGFPLFYLLELHLGDIFDIAAAFLGNPTSLGAVGSSTQAVSRSDMAQAPCGDKRAVKEENARRHPMRAPSSPACLVMLAAVGLLPACASAPLVQGGGLSSYAAMKPSNGLITKSHLSLNRKQVLAAKTVKIAPTAFSPTVAPELSTPQRALVANAVDRALCIGLSDRFKVVTTDEPADLTVQASVTRATVTGKVAAGVSTAASLGMNFVDVGVPIPTPRIPIGMGSLSIEAEAVDPSGQQQASMLWAKGANAFFSSPRVSKVSDAYDLADGFGDDFGQFLVKGKSPFGGGPSIDLPSWHKIKSAAGLRPKHAACENFGRYRGIPGMIGDQFGLPPEWTDKGAKKAAQ